MVGVLLASWMGHAQINILTANGDNGRTNSNLQETQLSPATVNPVDFGKLGSFAVDSQVYSQPLYVSGLTIPKKGTRNVVYVSTLHNSVYAFDADSMAPVSLFWHVNLGPSVPSTLLYGPNGDISGEVGVVSTGAIDPVRGVLYVIADVLQSGAPAFYLHALDLATGAERLNGPVLIAASVVGTGSGSRTDGTIPFDARQHLQRPGLLLANGSVYAGFGSHGDQYPYHGWMVGYNASDLSLPPVAYQSTPDGNGGSFWQSGRGPALDSQGNIYAVTGNGDFDGVRNFGQSFLKLPANLSAPLSWYTPADWKSMSDADFDLSAGPALIAGTKTLIGGDKAGNLYAIDGSAMNQPLSASVVSASAGSIFNFAVWSRGGDANIYTQGDLEPVKCFQITGGTLSSSPVSQAPGLIQYSRIGLTVSANGDQADSGILWETAGDYNLNLPGTLHAYDASDLTHELWNSDMSPVRDKLPPITKFVAPTVANGKVYVAGNGNAVTVYGLFASAGDTVPTPSIAAVTNAASYTQNGVSPGELVAIFGSSLGPSTPAGLQLDDSGNVATTLGGAQVLFDGVPGPMVFASSGQIDAIVPFGVSKGSTEVQVLYQGQSSASYPVTVADSDPAVFSADSSGAGQAVLLNEDGSPNSLRNPAKPGSIVTFWATGAGQLSPLGIDGSVVAAGNLPRTVLRVLAQVDGQPVEVLYAGGAPGMVEGVIQVNLRIPSIGRAGATAAVPLVLNVGDNFSQPGITLAIAVP
jgi:uncharacterized protein (TIGR03437 family)